VVVGGLFGIRVHVVSNMNMNSEHTPHLDDLQLKALIKIHPLQYLLGLLHLLLIDFANIELNRTSEPKLS